MSEHRYNLALLPPVSAYSIYQTYAQEMFQTVHGPYLLGNKSLPHITLCQFTCAEPQTLEAIKGACASLSFPAYFPEFLGLSITSESQVSPADLFWIGLMVIREEPLVQMHQKIKDVLKNVGLSCLGRHGEQYRPHLTLANAYLTFPFTLPQWPQAMVGKSPYPFTLALGRAGTWGQFMEVCELEKLDSKTGDKHI